MKRILDRVINFIMALLLMTMALVVFTQVFFRYVLNAPLSWAEEIARVFIVWLAFIGGYIALRENKHVGFNLLLKKLPERLQWLVSILAQILIIIFFVVFVRQGLVFSSRYLNMSMPYTGISVGWAVYSVFPISGFLMLIQSVISLWNIMSNRKN